MLCLCLYILKEKQLLNIVIVHKKYSNWWGIRQKSSGPKENKVWQAKRLLDVLNTEFVDWHCRSSYQCHCLLVSEKFSGVVGLSLSVSRSTGEGVFFQYFFSIYYFGVFFLAVSYYFLLLVLLVFFRGGVKDSFLLLVVMCQLSNAYSCFRVFVSVTDSWFLVDRCWFLNSVVGYCSLSHWLCPATVAYCC